MMFTMSADVQDEALLSQARDRAQHLVESLTSDRVSLEGASWAGGAAVCEEAAEAARQVMRQIETELRQPASPFCREKGDADVAPTGFPKPASENSHP
jgi:hypothetical protein